MHEVGYFLQQVGFVDLVGNLGDDDGVLIVRHVLDNHLGPNQDMSPPGLVRLADAFAAVDDSPGGEIRSRHDIDQVFVGAFGIVDDLDDSTGYLAQVVGRDVGGHADGDTGRTVADQVGKFTGENHRLLASDIVVIHEIDRLFVQVGQYFHGNRRQTRFRVTHGRRAIAVDGPKIALSINQRVAHVEVLRHADQGRVYHLLTVRVIVTGSITGDFGAFAMWFAGIQIQIVHGYQYSAIGRLEAVANIRQSPVGDHRH